MAVTLPTITPMISVDETIAIEGIRRFLKLHATCGHAVVDTPPLPGGTGYRVVAACRCGDTAEYWLTAGFVSSSLLAAVVTEQQPEPARIPRAA